MLRGLCGSNIIIENLCVYKNLNRFIKAVQDSSLDAKIFIFGLIANI